MVTRSRPERLKPGSSVIVVGDECAGGLGPFLGQLAVGKKVNLRFEWQRGQPFEHWFSADRLERLLRRKPDAILFVFGTKATNPETLALKLREVRRLAGPTALRWVLPLSDGPETMALRLALAAEDFDVLHSEALDLHRSQTGAPSARGYAGWAGAIWAWMR
jgi:hypothetical protein